ncbi:signal peptidase I [Myxococcaceae bacterium]|jgi:signal peptidase I|nr:signal peptidase I [Myxococcaceae bacterium]
MSPPVPRAATAAGTTERTESNRPGWIRSAWDQGGTLVVAVLLALSIRACIIEPFRIPSSSMFPTLLIGDHLFVNKLAYGARIPFTDLRLPSFRDPARGDVVVFDVARNGSGIVPADRRPDLPRDTFVKRIVGMPGDRVEVRGGVLHLNGEPVPTKPVAEKFVDEHGRRLDEAIETLGEVDHGILDAPGSPGLDLRPIVVEPGRYLMMGDNRDNSRDSREWGTVAREDMRGPAMFLYWSWDSEGYGWLGMLSPLTWWDLLVNKMRWERLGDPVR